MTRFHGDVVELDLPATPPVLVDRPPALPAPWPVAAVAEYGGSSWSSSSTARPPFGGAVVDVPAIAALGVPGGRRHCPGAGPGGPGGRAGAAATSRRAAAGRLRPSRLRSERRHRRGPGDRLRPMRPRPVLGATGSAGRCLQPSSSPGPGGRLRVEVDGDCVRVAGLGGHHPGRPGRGTPPPGIGVTFAAEPSTESLRRSLVTAHGPADELESSSRWPVSGRARPSARTVLGGGGPGARHRVGHRRRPAGDRPAPPPAARPVAAAGRPRRGRRGPGRGGDPGDDRGDRLGRRPPAGRSPAGARRRPRRRPGPHPSRPTLPRRRPGCRPGAGTGRSRTSPGTTWDAATAIADDALIGALRAAQEAWEGGRS